MYDVKTETIEKYINDVRALIRALGNYSDYARSAIHSQNKHRFICFAAYGLITHYTLHDCDIKYNLSTDAGYFVLTLSNKFASLAEQDFKSRDKSFWLTQLNTMEQVTITEVISNHLTDNRFSVDLIVAFPRYKM